MRVDWCVCVVVVFRTYQEYSLTHSHVEPSLSSRRARVNRAPLGGSHELRGGAPSQDRVAARTSVCARLRARAVLAQNIVSGCR